MLRKASRIVYFLSFFIFPLLVMQVAGQRLANLPLRLVVFCLLVLGGSWVFTQAWPGERKGLALLITALGYGSLYKLASFIPDVSSFPFSLSWSEGSRYYYASLWLSKLVYGVSLPPSVLHPTRYLLQAFPFLIPHASLWFNRLWQVILWVVTASLTSGLLVKRLKLSSHKSHWIVALAVFLWAFLFLFQGPVYYHLLIMVILVLWAYDRKHFWRTLLVVLAASVWAGISRINWLPVPGLLAASLYLLEVKTEGKSFWRYISAPVIWVLVGTVTGYATQQAYQFWSGNPPAWFGSSFTSDLLWYRLLPNPTFPLGILPSAALVSLPLAAIMLLRLWSHWRNYHFIRLLGLAGILGVLLAGGIVVSVKIGGGSNLHNLDAYLSLLLVIGAFIFFNRFEPDSTVQSADNSPQLDQPSNNPPSQLVEKIRIAGAVLIPLYFTLIMGGLLPKWDFQAAQSALQTINSATQQVASQGGEVLFISQRHLLTFDYVQNVPLVPEDELVFLMEMAMSDNTSYMDAFNADISHQRFAMIVSEPLTIQYQGRSHGFGEENDAWVSRVSEPVLCYYQPSINLEQVNLVLYTPRTSPCK